MKFFIVLILCLQLFTITVTKKADEEAYLEQNTVVYNNIKPSIKLNSPEEYQKLLNTTDITHLLFYYKRVHARSQEVAQYLIKIAAKLEYLSSILLVDCASKYGQTLEACANVFQSPQDYPKVKILTPPEYRFNPITGKQNVHEEVNFPENNLTEENIYNFLTTNIISRSSKLSIDNIDMFTK
jgi:hypothetical protein